MSDILQLKITLDRIEPPIWRRILIPQGATFSQLHHTIQRVMGWENCHLHEFRVSERRISEPGFGQAEFPGADQDGDQNTLSDFSFQAGDSFEYEYDFGDGWRHDVLVEAIVPAAFGQRYPVCLDGQRACPPEDCGGAGGYAYLLEVMGNPKGKRFKEMMIWFGGPFDPEAFDLGSVNKKLAMLSRKKK